MGPALPAALENGQPVALGALGIFIPRSFIAKAAFSIVAAVAETGVECYFDGCSEGVSLTAITNVVIDLLT